MLLEEMEELEREKSNSRHTAHLTLVPSKINEDILKKAKLSAEDREELESQLEQDMREEEEEKQWRDSR